MLERFNTLSEQIARRAYAIFEGNGNLCGHDLENWFKAESEILHPVHLRVAEKDSGVTVEAEVPGFTPKELEVSLDGTRLTISGKKETKKEQEQGKTIYQEQCSQQIMRVIDLPVEVDGAKAAATLKNGVLEITIPKAVEALVTTRRVEVKGA
jgi:HSP20 family protein